MRPFVKAATVLALLVGFLAYPAALAVDLLAGKDVWMIEPKDPAIVATEREDWKREQKPGAKARAEEVAGLYGSVFGRERVLFASSDRVFSPEEDPSISVLNLWKSKGENPLQARTVRFLGLWTSIGAAIVGVLGLVLLRTVFRRAPVP